MRVPGGSVEPSSHEMRGKTRLWVFRIATAVIIPALLLVSAEGILRLSGFGYASDLTIPCTVQGRSAFCDNDHFTWQFFPPGAFRLPSAFAIPAEKKPNTYRIFIVGESAAQGDPEPSYAFGRYLEVMLRERFPSMRFEVINTGITAVNSHVLLPAVRDLAKREGDLFVLYIGNNEVVGPYGAGTTLTQPGTNLALIRAGIFLNSTRLGQLIVAAFRWGKSDPRTWRGMEMFREQRVSADAPAMASVYRNFRHNLRDIIATARKSGAHVLISTVAVNLKDGAPFASLHRPDLGPEKLATWNALLREGTSFEEKGRHDDALKAYLSAAELDNRYAELQYRIARCHLALGNFAAAREGFGLASELDGLRFRADTRINEIIRKVAAKWKGVALLDGERLFAAASPNEIPGRELFYDHVHMKPAGNYLLARSLFPRVVALLPAEVRSTGETTEPLTEEQAERLLALTAYDRRRVARTVLQWLNEPPFTARIDNGEQIRALQGEAEGGDRLEEITTAYQWAIDRAPQDRWLHLNRGLFLLNADNPAAAADSFRRVLELLPGSYVAREKLANSLVQLGRFEDAITEYQELLRRMPYHAPAYLAMGYAQARLSLFDSSIASYEHAIELHPMYALDAYTNMGVIQLYQGKFDRAAASFENAIKADSTHVRTAALSHQLSYALEKLGRHGDAVRVLQDDAAGAPGSFTERQ